MERKTLLLLIIGSQISGLGRTLKAIDKDNKGSEDIAGNIAFATGEILTALATSDKSKLKTALETNISVSQELLATL